MENESPSRWRKLIAALKPATVRSAIVRLIIAALVASGVTVSVDPETASTVFAIVLSIVEATL